MLFAAMYRRLFMSLTLGVVSASLAVAQLAPGPTAQGGKSVPSVPTVPVQQPPVVNETVSVGYVMIPFTVLNEKNLPLTDLSGRAVNLLVDGEPVSSDMFEKSANAPVSFTILIDGSGSMALAGKMDSARA